MLAIVRQVHPFWIQLKNRHVTVARPPSVNMETLPFSSSLIFFIGFVIFLTKILYVLLNSYLSISCFKVLI